MVLYDLTHDVIAAAFAGAAIAGQRSAVAPRGIVENNDSFTWFLIIIDVGPSARCSNGSSIDKNAPEMLIRWHGTCTISRTAPYLGAPFGQPSRHQRGSPFQQKSATSRIARSPETLIGEREGLPSAGRILIRGAELAA